MNDSNYLKSLDLIEDLANLSSEKYEYMMSEIKALHTAVIILGASVLLLVLAICHLWGK